MTFDAKTSPQEPKRYLYPQVRARLSGRLKVSDGHEIYMEECGNPSAPAVIVLHGGPGGGCSPAMRRFFDPQRWRIILFDQRGCGRSRPYGALSANTTWHLVRDIEAIRDTLKLERFVLFGGSWGSTLALAYAQTHPARVSGMILRGVFLCSADEFRWFYGGEAGHILPEAWEAFLGALEPTERGAPISAYYARLTSRSQRIRREAAEAWCAWETAAINGAMEQGGMVAPLSPQATYTLARMETHYFHHSGFLERPDQLLEDAHLLAGIPGAIIQGRRDLVTPPAAAYRLAEVWEDAQLEIMSRAGHAASDPSIVDGLVRATDRLADERDG
jgi:proline iminopeptidase